MHLQANTGTRIDAKVSIYTDDLQTLSITPRRDRLAVRA